MVRLAAEVATLLVFKPVVSPASQAMSLSNFKEALK